MTTRADAHGRGVSAATHYRTAMIDGVSIFNREADPKDAPVVLLLHGFPSSARMFRNLIPQLADAYHVIAPDYPAFGHSDTLTEHSSPTVSTTSPRSSTICSMN